PRDVGRGGRQGGLPAEAPVEVRFVSVLGAGVAEIAHRGAEGGAPVLAEGNGEARTSVDERALVLEPQARVDVMRRHRLSPEGDAEPTVRQGPAQEARSSALVVRVAGGVSRVVGALALEPQRATRESPGVDARGGEVRLPDEEIVAIRNDEDLTPRLLVDHELHDERAACVGEGRRLQNDEKYRESRAAPTH